MNGDETSESEAPPSQRRIIKRYSNRKLYDTKGSSYVTLLQIAEMIRAGEDVQIIDNATKEDKTDVTLALIISEELRSKPRAIPIATLKALIRHRGERILTHLREGPIGKLIPKEEGGLAGSEPPEAPGDEDMSQGKEGKGLRATLEQWQTAIDERIRTVLPNFAAFRDLETEVRRISERLDDIERRLPGQREPGSGEAPGGPDQGPGTGPGSGGG
jgi:polyhydroxyalkanoate synthesis repressor PhaR